MSAEGSREQIVPNDDVSPPVNQKVDLWLASFGHLSTLPAYWIQSLDDRERAQAARLPDPTLYIGRHAMMRSVLAEYVDRRSDMLRFRAGPFGKPAITPEDSRPAPFFNLSRSGDRAVLAVSWAGEIGVDIENVVPIDLSIARLFSEHEQRALAALPPGEAFPAFYRYWVCKEAVMKLTGRGVSLALDQIEISDPSQPAAVLSLEGDRTSREYKLSAFEIGPSLIGAVATSFPFTLTFHEWHPASTTDVVSSAAQPEERARPR